MDARRYLEQSNRRRIDRRSRSPKREHVPWSARVKRLLLIGCWLITGGIIGSSVWLLPVVWEWLDRPIAWVGVSGTMNYIDRVTLQRRLMPLVNTTFFQTDLALLQQSLQGDSWIRSAEVRKIWPETVEIALEEELPIARWMSADMINANGKILRGLQGHDFSALPTLGGPAGREQEVMQQYQTLSHHLRPLGLKVSAVELSQSGDWSFTTDHVRVVLGRAELLERMQHFSHLYQGSLQSRWQQVKSVDLRYRDGAAVAWLKRGHIASSQ